MVCKAGASNKASSASGEELGWPGTASAWRGGGGARAGGAWCSMRHAAGHAGRLIASILVHGHDRSNHGGEGRHGGELGGAWRHERLGRVERRRSMGGGRPRGTRGWAHMSSRHATWKTHARSDQEKMQFRWGRVGQWVGVPGGASGRAVVVVVVARRWWWACMVAAQPAAGHACHLKPLSVKGVQRRGRRRSEYGWSRSKGHPAGKAGGHGGWRRLAAVPEG